MSLVRRIAAIPKPLLTILALVFVAALWVVDYVTGPDLSPLIFYVVPVVLAVWFGGRRPGVLVSIVAAFAWFQADYLTGRHEHAHPAILYWNGIEKLLFFLLLVELLATLKSALERERHARQEFLERELRIAEQVQERLFPSGRRAWRRSSAPAFAARRAAWAAITTTFCRSKTAEWGSPSATSRARASPPRS